MPFLYHVSKEMVIGFTVWFFSLIFADIIIAGRHKKDIAAAVVV